MGEFKIQNEIVGVGKVAQSTNELCFPKTVELGYSRFPTRTV